MPQQHDQILLKRHFTAIVNCCVNYAGPERIVWWWRAGSDWSQRWVVTVCQQNDQQWLGRGGRVPSSSASCQYESSILCLYTVQYFIRVVKTARSFWPVNRDQKPVNCHRLRCAHCHCTTPVCRSSFTHCSRPKCNCSCPSHPPIKHCNQAKFDTCQEPTCRLHALQWKRRCCRLGRLMSRDVDMTDHRTDNRQSDMCSHCRPTECWMPRQMFLCFGIIIIINGIYIAQVRKS